MDDATKKQWLETLQQYGISVVYGEFDGSGDSGQVHFVSCEGLTEDHAPETIELSEHHKELYSDKWSTPTDLRSLLVTFIDELLSSTDYDWYNNDGGYGEVKIVPGDGTIDVEMNIRHIESTHYKLDLSLELTQGGNNG